MRTPTSRFRTAALTLAETLVTTAILGTMMGLVMETTVQLYKNFGGIEAYRSVHENARRSMALFSRDLRAGSSLTAYTSNDVTFTAVDTLGASRTIRYQVQSGFLNRTVTASNGTARTEVLTDNVTAVQFERWTRPGVPAAYNPDAFEVRAVLAITNTAFYRVSTDTLQTRVRMRNKTY